MKKSLSITTGLIFALFGAVAGVVLRLLNMLGGFDYETGFYTDGGVTAWLSLLLPILFAGAAVYIFVRQGDGFRAYARGRDILSGALAAFSGVILLYGGAALAQDYAMFRDIGYSRMELTQQPLVHISLMVMSFAFGAVQLAASMGFVTGFDIFGKAPLLYAVGVLWGMANLVSAYVFYASSSSFVENFFTVGGGALLLLGLLYACKLLAGVDEPAAARRLMIWGGAGTALTAPYHLVNLVLFFMGRTYQGEMPAVLSLCILSVGLFLLALMAGYCRTSTVEPRHF